MYCVTANSWWILHSWIIEALFETIPEACIVQFLREAGFFYLIWKAIYSIQHIIKITDQLTKFGSCINRYLNNTTALCNSFTEHKQLRKSYLWKMAKMSLRTCVVVKQMQSNWIRRSRTPVRHSRTPVRRSRTPVRRTRGMDESRDSTHSRSPIWRSSSSEFSPRDASPVDFSAALDSAEKVKDKSISDEEDDKGSLRKVSVAQYHLFRQAVTSSEDTFKVNPSKSHRASRASLLDLGEGEMTDSVMVGPAVTCGHPDFYRAHSWP